MNYVIGKNFDAINTPELKREMVMTFYNKLIDGFKNSGATEHTNVENIYNQFNDQKLIVRRENPRTVKNIINGNDIELGHDASLGDEYANCVEWTSSYGSHGLDNAFSEGHGHYEGLVTVIGFENGDDLTVSNIEDVTKGIGGGKDRSLVRCAKGIIHQKDIRFIIIRIPASRFDYKKMTEDEQEKYDELSENANGKPIRMNIFRGLTLPKHKIEKQKLAA